MNLERERKFLIEGPIPDDINIVKDYLIWQWYITTEPDEIRLRRVRYTDGTSAKYYMCVKSGRINEYTREETEVEISEETFETIMSNYSGLSESKPLMKLRTVIDDNGTEITIDEYRDKFCNSLHSLVVAEVEFEDDEAALNYEHPEWFGKEITDDRCYSNSMLFSYLNRKGGSHWTRI